MRNLIITILAITALICFSFTSSIEASTSQYSNFEKTHSEDEGNENNTDEDTGYSNFEVDEDLNPETPDGKDRTN